MSSSTSNNDQPLNLPHGIKVAIPPGTTTEQLREALSLLNPSVMSDGSSSSVLVASEAAALSARAKIKAFVKETELRFVKMSQLHESHEALLNKTIADKEACQEKISMAETKLKNLEATRDILENDIREQNYYLESLTNECNRYTRQMSQATRYLESKKMQLSEAESELAFAEKEHERIRGMSNDSKVKLKRVTNGIKNQEKELDAIELHIIISNGEKTNSTKKLYKLDEKLRSLERSDIPSRSTTVKDVFLECGLSMDPIVSYEQIGPSLKLLQDFATALGRSDCFMDCDFRDYDRETLFGLIINEFCEDTTKWEEYVETKKRDAEVKHVGRSKKRCRTNSF